MRRRTSWLWAALVTVLVHGLLGYLVQAAPVPTRQVKVEPVKKAPPVRAVSETIVLKKPEPPKPEPPKPEPPKPEPPKPEPPKKEVPKEEPKAKKVQKKKKKKKRKKGQPKRRKKSTKPAKPDEPKPLVLDKDYVSANSAITVQTGDEDSFGDSAVKATPENTRPDTDDGKDDGVEVGGETTRAVRYTPARIKKRFGTGAWPDDAPRLARVVTVKLSLYVGKDGRVDKVKIIKGAGGAFDRAAKRVGRKQLFFPRKKNGSAVGSWVPWTVEFRPD